MQTVLILPIVHFIFFIPCTLGYYEEAVTKSTHAIFSSLVTSRNAARVVFCTGYLLFSLVGFPKVLFYRGFDSVTNENSTI